MRPSCTTSVQPTAFPFALPVPTTQSSTWFILSAFTAFATSGDALIGLSLLGILGRRSWIVSLAPSYMPFFCVSIIQRAFLLCGRKRSRTAETIRGSGVRKKLATQKKSERLSIQSLVPIVPSDLVKNPLVFADLRADNNVLPSII